MILWIIVFFITFYINVMTFTPVEQIDSTDRLDPEYEDVYSSGSMIPLYLANRSTFLFASVVIGATVIALWRDLESWISSAVRLVVSPVKVLVSGGCWLVMRLAANCSVGEPQTMLPHRALTPIFAFAVGCFAPLRHLDPSVRPLVMVSGLGLLVTLCRKVYSAVLSPAYQFLYGFALGLTSESTDQSGFCHTALWLFEHVPGRLIRRQWLEACLCLGERAGLDTRMFIEDDLPRLIDHLVGGEIHHLYAIAFAVTCVSLVILAAFSSDVVPCSIAVWRWFADALRGWITENVALETQLPGEPLTDQVSRLSDIISWHEGKLQQLEESLAVKERELRVAKQERDDGRAKVKYLTARCERDELAHRREALQISQLRQHLGSVEGQLKIARGSEVDATGNERHLLEKVATLQQQLADRGQAEGNSLSELQSLRAECLTRNDQLASIEHRLAAANARETEHQQLSAAHDKLVAEHASLQEGYDALMSEGTDADSVTKAFSQWRDSASAEYTALQAEFVRRTNIAEEYFVKTQSDLARASNSVIEVQRSNTELRSTFAASVAKERSATDEARRRGTELAAGLSEAQGEFRSALTQVTQLQKEVGDSNKAIEVLEHRLSKHTGRSGAQEIPTVKTGNMGSISTALAESQVTVSMQQSEIDDLKRQLDSAKASAQRSDGEQAAREVISRLRRNLDTEKQARIDDQVRLSRRIRDLNAEVQRLNISASNANAGRGLGRGSGMRQPSRS